jgi:hypothetical protein
MKVDVGTEEYKSVQNAASIGRYTELSVGIADGL